MKRKKAPQPVPGNRTLTERESEVFEFVVSGMTNAEIADELARSVKTIEAHKHNILVKLGAESGADLIRRYARRRKTKKAAKKGRKTAARKHR